MKRNNLFCMIREPEAGIYRYEKIYVYADTVHAARYYAAKQQGFLHEPHKYIEFNVFLRSCSVGIQQHTTAEGGNF